LATALSGLYKRSGVDIVREQIANSFGNSNLHYDVAERSLVIWPLDSFATEIRYDLDARPNLIPVSVSGTGAGADKDHAGFEPLSAEQVLLSEQPIFWETWVAYWESPAATASSSSVTAHPVIRLPVAVAIRSPSSAN